MADIYLWKGIWDGVDCWCGRNAYTAICTLIGGTVVLIAFGALKSASSLPIGFAIDDVANCCSASTYLSTTVGSSASCYKKQNLPHFGSLALVCLQSKDTALRKAGDMFLSAVIETFVVLAWHGLWTLEDLYVHDIGMSNEVSAWISVGIGVALSVIVFVLQFPIARYFDATVDDKTLRTFVIKRSISIVPGILSLVSTVNSFRGYWYLLDEYLMPGRSAFVFFATSACGIDILIIF